MSRPTRAETLTGSTRNLEYFSDFTSNFVKSPMSNQLSRVINEKSINQSLKNLILTNLGERLFQPYIGTNVNATLFENNYPEDLDRLEFFIETTIRNNETRVNLISVTAVSGNNENEIIISIVYNTINNPEPITFEYILKRVR